MLPSHRELACGVDVMRYFGNQSLHQWRKYRIVREVIQGHATFRIDRLAIRTKGWFSKVHWLIWVPMEDHVDEDGAVQYFIHSIEEAEGLVQNYKDNDKHSKTPVEADSVRTIGVY